MTAPSPADLASELARHGSALRGLDRDRLLTAWDQTVESFRDPGSAERRRLADPLARATGLSPPGLDAALEAVLGGARREVAATTFAAAQDFSAPLDPALVILSGNLPALVVQTLLPALALGRPALFKAPRQEPHFTAAFLASLIRRLPVLGQATASAVWQGGDPEIEAPLFERVGRILIYGDEAATADVARRAPGKTHVYGPKTSLAIIDEASPKEATIRGLGRDIALFDQRGCLSISAVFCTGDGRDLAQRLGRELARRARQWPPGRPALEAAATVRQWRETATLRGLFQADLDPAAGTVIVAPEATFLPSPGQRAVRVHPLQELADGLESLRPWRGKLQGAALAGPQAWALRHRLTELGLSRFAAVGELQSPTASWHNGGRDPLAIISE